MSKLRVGVIGFGKISRRVHVPCFRMHDNVALVGVADSSDKALKEAKKRLNPAVATNDVSELLGANLDLVDICTPPSTHAALCDQAMDSCRNILVEKPLATSLEDAERIVKKASDRGVNLCVVQNLRFKPSVVEMKRSQDEGTLGRLLTLYVVAHWHSPDLMPDRADMILEQIHPIDLITWMCGRPSHVLAKPVNVCRDHPAVSDFKALIDFSGQGMAILDWSCFAGCDNFILDAFGTGAWGRTDIWRDTYTISSARSPYPFETIMSSVRYSLKLAGMVVRKKVWNWQWSGHVNLIAAYLRTIEAGLPPPVSAEGCLDAIEVAEAIRKSLSLGTEIELVKSSKVEEL